MTRKETQDHERASMGGSDPRESLPRWAPEDGRSHRLPLFPVKRGLVSERVKFIGAGSFAAILGFWFAWVAGLAPQRELEESRSWVEVPCEIISSKLSQTRVGLRERHRVRVRYRYFFQGEAYEGDRFDFSAGSTEFGLRQARTAVDALSAGAWTMCAVDPNDPSRAVISREAPGAMWYGGASFALGLLGLGAVIKTLRRKRPSPADVG